ncbi:MULTISPECIES: ABC transporter permease subunit [Kitasatospora]|uniref:ABC transporter permease subunit n=1 Tax=Kitasatospora cathayae TaxID=3004092 RepID=A0ABY7QDC7_9ACTN|nr:ABC transporter permease subunit [Kitasatospora sp. HUAS 3-15]WBP90728.1 ABC transporter permease subunit [Kitasatospora sp. HUAS 3-15]
MTPGTVSRRLPLVWLALHRRRRMLLTLLIAMVVFEVLIVVIAGTVPTNEVFGARRTPPGAFKAFSGSSGDVSIASYPGLLGAGLTHPVWIALQLTVIGSLGAAAVAADVESGTIELLMTRPVSRRRLLAERAGALIAASVLLNAAATLAVSLGVAFSPKLRAAVPEGGVFAAGLLGCALTFCLIGPVLAVSALSRRRAHVVGAAVVLGAGGFALNFIALAWSPAGPLRYLSPFHYYAPGDALAHGGVPWTSPTVLLGVGLLGLLAAFRLLERRDLAI